MGINSLSKKIDNNLKNKKEGNVFYFKKITFMYNSLYIYLFI